MLLLKGLVWPELWAGNYMCMLCHYNYLEDPPASSDDSTGHMVKVIARWQAVNILQSTEHDARLYCYLACLI